MCVCVCLCVFILGILILAAVNQIRVAVACGPVLISIVAAVMWGGGLSEGLLALTWLVALTRNFIDPSWILMNPHILVRCLA